MLLGKVGHAEDLELNPARDASGLLQCPRNSSIPQHQIKAYKALSRGTFWALGRYRDQNLVVFWLGVRALVFLISIVFILLGIKV